MSSQTSLSPAAGRLRTAVTPLVLGVVCFVVFNANLRQIGSGDTLSARYLPLIVLHDHTLELDANARLVNHGHPNVEDGRRSDAHAQIVRLEPRAYWTIRSERQHLVSLYPVVTPLLVTPLYIPAAMWLGAHGWRQPHVDRVAEVMEKLSASILAALATVVMYLVLRRDRARWGVPLAGVFAFGTTTWVISSQALWQHGTGQLLIALALLLVLASPSPVRTAALGAVCVLMAANRPPDVLIAGAFALFVIWTQRRRALWLVAGAIVPLAAVLYYNIHVVGHIAGGYGLATSRGASLAQSRWLGLPGLLVSPARGLLVFAPFLVFVPIGLMQRMRAQRSKALAVALSAAVIAQLVAYSLGDWRAGASWGPRWMTNVLPILVWMLAPAVVVLRSRGRVLLVSAMVASVGIQAIGAFWYTKTSDDQIFAGDARWFRGAWDVTNIPFVSELRHPPARRDLLYDTRGSLDRVGSRLVRTIDEVPTLEQGAVLEGWALAGTRTPAQIIAVIDGTVIGSSEQFEPRTDVSRAVRTTSPSGWRLHADTRGVSAGQRVLQLAVRTEPRSDIRIIRDQRVIVAPQPSLETMADGAAAHLRDRQEDAGYWLTSFTRSTQYLAPKQEMNTYLTSMLVDVLSPVASRHGLESAVARARGHLASQIEDDGLVRYHGRPDASTIGTLGCAITPDADDTALVWRIAGDDADVRRQHMLDTLEQYRDPRGLYRTWLAQREHYQCLDPGRDPNPTDVAIQMHVYLMLRELNPPAAKRLCDALRRAWRDDRNWTYYAKTTVVPYLRSAELRSLGCMTPLPAERLSHASAGQEVWSEAARLVVESTRSPGDANVRRSIQGLLRRLADHDFASLRQTPPLLYHNDLTSTVPRFYWSEDVGYALWLRLYEALPREPE